MKKVLVPLILATAAVTVQAKPLDDTNPPPSFQPDRTPGEFSHVATIGDYKFRIFIDKSVAPPKAYAVQTDESIEKMDKAKSPLKEIKRSSREVRIYLRELMGLPPLVEPADLPEDEPNNRFGQARNRQPLVTEDDRPPVTEPAPGLH